MVACKRAGIKDFIVHDLRLEALSRPAERGDFSVQKLAAVSGHMLKRDTKLQVERLAERMRKPVSSGA